jgi:hypothetical protein
MARTGLVGIDLARASLKMKGYRSCPFGCKAGSQFHHGCVSRGPPIMPDGRVSPVRFQGRYFRRAFPSAARSRVGRFACVLRAHRLPRLCPVLCRGTQRACALPCERLLPLYPRGPRSGPGYIVPVHQRLIGPMRPTCGHISHSEGISYKPQCGEVVILPTPRRPTSGSVLSLAILYRHVVL